MASLQETASQIRRDIVRMVHGVQSGHPGGSLGCADFLTALYFNTMKHDPSFNMDGVGEDLFFLSNGHISPLLYSCLARTGYFPVSELGTFRKLNTRLQGQYKLQAPGLTSPLLLTGLEAQSANDARFGPDPVDCEQKPDECALLTAQLANAPRR